jgi:hypothetical protein
MVAAEATTRFGEHRAGGIAAGPRGLAESHASEHGAQGAPRIGFLFNHDAPHQVAHSAPIAFELSRRHPECSVVLMMSSDEQARALEAIAARFPGHACRFVSLRARGPLARLGKIVGKLAPLQKVALLRSNAGFLDGFTALVVPEKTSLMLRTRFGCTSPLLIHTRHGAGDRAIGFDRQSREFDFALLAGEKIRRRLESAGALPPRWAIVGYPKFDAFGSDLPSALPSFRNQRPIVLYNPHCSPRLSSWFPIGLDILEFFRRSDRFNLIFAPHVMLFRRRLQVGLNPPSVAWVRRVPGEYFACDNIHIDLGSQASMDMTYTGAADLYLGDVSSQVCEFLVRPRPCLFANPRRLRWQNDPSFEAWRLGPVFEDPSELGSALDAAFRTHGDYVEAQREYVRETFDLRELSSAARAADAIRSFVAESGRGARAEPSGAA